jgi:hypothetical protein
MSSLDNALEAARRRLVHIGRPRGRVLSSSDTDEFSFTSGGIAEFRLHRYPGEFF